MTHPLRETLEQAEKAFDAYADTFDTESDAWQDKGANDYFIAGYQAALASLEAQEPVVRIRTWTKTSLFSGEPEGHAELMDWLDGADSLEDGEHELYAHPIDTFKKRD